MGAKASRERVENPSAVMIVFAGGKVETYNRPLSALEVMLWHPGHVLTRPDVFTSDIRKALVTPETVLLPGNKYFLVPYRTMKWLVDHHVSSIRMPYNLSNGIIHPGYGATDPIHGVINPSYGVTDPIDGVVMPFHDSAMANPRQPQVIVKHRPSITVTIKQPHPARGRIAKGRTGKSPLRAARSSESFQRSRRSNPKVSPGEDGAARLEQESAIGPSISNGEAMVKDEGMAWKGKTTVEDESAFSSPHEDDGQLSIDPKRKEVYQEPKSLHCRTASNTTSKTNPHATLGYHLLQLSSLSGYETNDGSEEELNQGASFNISSPVLPLSMREAFPETSTPMLLISSPKEEAPPCLSPWTEIVDHANSMLQKEKGSPEIIRVRDLYYEHNLLQEPEGDPKKISLFELLKFPDLNLADLFEDGMVDSPSAAPSADMMDAHELHEADMREKEDTSGNLLLDPIKVQDQEGVMLQEQEEGTPNQTLSKVLKVSELHQEDRQQKGFQFPAFAEDDDHQDLGVQTVLKLHNMVQEDDNEKEWQGGPLLDDNQDQELQRNIMTHDVVQASVSQQKTVPMEDCNLAVPTLPNIETGELQGMIQGQQKDTQVRMATESCHDQQQSNVSLPLEVVGLEKSVQPCVCMEEEVVVPGCQPEKMLSEVHGGQDIYVVDGSNKARPSEEVNLEERLTLNDYFLQHSPNHQHMIDLGVINNGMNQCFMSGTSSAAASPSSLSWFMGIVSPHMRRSDQVSVQQVKTGARKQQNLTILGFNSLKSDSLSIFEQVKAHKRAHRLNSGKASSSCHAQEKSPQIGSVKSEVQQPSKMEQEQGQQRQQQQQCHLPQQQEQHKVEKQQALLPAAVPPPPPPPPTHHLGLPPRFFHHKIRPFRYRPPRKPLSPIMEFSPETSSASVSPLNSYPSQ